MYMAAATSLHGLLKVEDHVHRRDMLSPALALQALDARLPLVESRCRHELEAGGLDRVLDRAPDLRMRRMEDDGCHPARLQHLAHPREGPGHEPFVVIECVAAPVALLLRVNENLVSAIGKLSKPRLPEERAVGIVYVCAEGRIREDVVH